MLTADSSSVPCSLTRLCMPRLPSGSGAICMGVVELCSVCVEPRVIYLP